MTYTIEVGNRRSYLKGDFSSKVVDDALSCFQTNYEHTPRYKTILTDPRTGEQRRAWDGKKRFYHSLSRSLPTGLVPQVLKAEPGGRVRYLEEALPLPVRRDVVREYGGLVPWEHQLEAVWSVLHSELHPLQKGVIRVGTGGGKSLITAMLAYAFDVPTLVVIHGQQLVNQTHAELAKFLGKDKVGWIMGKEWHPAQITVASVDTLAPNLSDPEVKRLLASIKVLVGDEAHRISKGTATFHKVFDKCLSAVVRIGLSGTPFQSIDDVDMLLMSRTGPLLYDISPRLLQERGILCPAQLLVYEWPWPRRPFYSWHEASKHLIYENAPRTAFLAKCAIREALEGRRVMVFCGNSTPYVHAWEVELQKQIREGRHGIKIACVTGRSGTDKVLKSVKQLRSGAIQILVNTVLFDEGTDVPGLDTLIFAGPQSSYKKVMQRLGRGLRKKDPGVWLRVIDVSDLTNKYLSKHFRARLEFYAQEEVFFDVQNPPLPEGLSTAYPPEVDDDDSFLYDDDDDDSLIKGLGI